MPIWVRSVSVATRPSYDLPACCARANALQVLLLSYGICNMCASRCMAMGRAACRVFRQLTGGEGDADLLLTMDKQVVFTEGILMSVRCARLPSHGAA